MAIDAAYIVVTSSVKMEKPCWPRLNRYLGSQCDGGRYLKVPYSILLGMLCKTCIAVFRLWNSNYGW